MKINIFFPLTAYFLNTTLPLLNVQIDIPSWLDLHNPEGLPCPSPNSSHCGLVQVSTGDPINGDYISLRANVLQGETCVFFASGDGSIRGRGCQQEARVLCQVDCSDAGEWTRMRHLGSVIQRNRNLVSLFVANCWVWYHLQLMYSTQKMHELPAERFQFFRITQLFSFILIHRIAIKKCYWCQWYDIKFINSNFRWLELQFGSVHRIRPFASEIPYAQGIWT